jgi:hypothetical protein
VKAEIGKRKPVRLVSSVVARKMARFESVRGGRND